MLDTVDPIESESNNPSRCHECVQLSADPCAAVLADIYRDEINLAVWQRTLCPEIQSAVRDLANRAQSAQVSLAVSPSTVRPSLSQALGIDARNPLCDDIVELVEMFSDLFGCSRVGLRFTTLEKPMCPRFHVDRLGCRLITTYAGVATEWLPHAYVDRARLAGQEAGLCAREQDIQRLDPGDVALLKGEGWEGNEGRGIVHRSPAMPAGEKRLMLTLDILSRETEI